MEHSSPTSRRAESPAKFPGRPRRVDWPQAAYSNGCARLWSGPAGRKSSRRYGWCWPHRRQSPPRSRCLARRRGVLRWRRSNLCGTRLGPCGQAGVATSANAVRRVKTAVRIIIHLPKVRTRCARKRAKSKSKVKCREARSAPKRKNNDLLRAQRASVKSSDATDSTIRSRNGGTRGRSPGPDAIFAGCLARRCRLIADERGGVG